jgi:hypothetical protein
MENRQLIEQQQLGLTAGKMKLAERVEVQLVTRQMVAQAERSLDIFTYDLAPDIYDQPPVIDAVKELALGCRDVCIRILLQNNERVQREGHRLIDLARRLTSRIEIRRPHADYLDHLENFLIADATGYIRRPVHSRYGAEVDFNDRYHCQKHLDFFNEVWQCSEQDSALRQLYI